MRSFFNSIKTSLISVKTYWHNPKEGNYVSNKEIAAFSGGGMGIKAILSLNTHIQMTPTCLLMGAVYGLSPSQLMILFLISNVIGIVKTPLVSWIVDNTNSSYGKFRPYLLWAAIPCVIGVIGITWLVPVDGSATQKMLLIAIFYNTYLIGQHIYLNSYTNISQVISPISIERNKIMSISELFANFGPSVVQFALPVFAQIFFGDEGLLKLQAYRILLPAFALLGFGLGLIVMLKTKERVIMPKGEKSKVKFIDGLRLAGGNRDFWIVSSSKFFEGCKLGIGLLLTWICLYQVNRSDMYGYFLTITSTAVVPGMVLAPLIIRKLGSKKAAFLSFALNAVGATVMLVTFKFGVAFFVIALYLFNFASGPQYIIQTSIMADALDEIQYKSRERVEGFAQNFYLMFGIMGAIAANFLFMLVFEHFGLSADANGMTDYEVLRDAAIRDPIITYVVLIAIAASLLSAFPFLFLTMTKDKHKQIIIELEKRKLEEESQ